MVDFGAEVEGWGLEGVVGGEDEVESEGAALGGGLARGEGRWGREGSNGKGGLRGAVHEYFPFVDVGFVEEAYFDAFGGGEGDVCEFLVEGVSKRRLKDMIDCHG